MTPSACARDKRSSTNSQTSARCAACASARVRPRVIVIELVVKKGRPLFEAIMESRVVRLRPILLTAGAAMLSSIPIVFDPIFSGLGWSLIFGLFAATLFTLFVIPVAYWLVYAGARSTR